MSYCGSGSRPRSDAWFMTSSRLGLPARRSIRTEHFCFDILSDETAGFPILTGHLAGLITLNLAEADDAERETRRVAFREPYRTLLGHFRHEVGHFYWEVLVGQTSLKSAFQLIFGFELRSYENALKAYHARTDRSYDRTCVHQRIRDLASLGGLGGDVCAFPPYRCNARFRRRAFRYRSANAPARPWKIPIWKPISRRC